MGVRVPVIFDRPLHWPGRGQAQSVNEVEDPGVIAWLEERLSVCERLWIVWVAPPTQEVGCVIVMGVWWNVLVCAVLYYWHCLQTSPVVGGNFLENGPP